MSEDKSKPDKVYKMIHLEGVALSPAVAMKRMVPFLSQTEEEPNHEFRFLRFENKLASAQDDHRFIHLERDKLAIDVPDGYYRPVKDGKDMLLIAHQVQLDLPALDLGAQMPTHFDNKFELKKFDAASLGGVAELLYQLAQRGLTISHQYAEQIPFGDYTVKMGKPGQKQVVLFEGIYTVGIMPLKLSF